MPKGYQARMGNTSIYLSNDLQIEFYLSRGCSIYEVDADGKQTLIATPEKGFLTKRPQIDKKYTVQLNRKTKRL